MKKSLIVIPVLALLVLAGCGKTSTATVSTGAVQTGAESMKTFDATGFSLQYPATRTYQKDVYGAQVMFFSPQPTGDKFRENIGVVEELLPTTMTVDNYYLSIKSQLQSLIKDYTETTNENITINGVAAKKIIYEGTQSSYKLKWMQVFIIKDKNAYVLNYTATADTFADFEKEATTIINSFMLK